MIKLNYTAEQFDVEQWGQALDGEDQITTTWSEIIWASITVGKRNWKDVWKFNSHSIFEAIFRATIVYANLMTTGKDNRITQTGVYKLLDPSEKGAVSYFHGLIFTKLLTQRLLNIPWLMHLDVYKDTINAVNSSRSRPDLIGQNINQDWFVFEAKGRSNNFDRRALDKAKIQTENIQRIEGHYPVLRTAVQTYFSSGYLRVRLEDPEGYSESATDIDISSDDFIYDYYKLILDLLSFKGDDFRFEYTDFIIVDLLEINLSLGLNKYLYELLSKREEFSFKRFKAILVENEIIIDTVKQEKENIYIGQDGVIIICGDSWSPDIMKKEPEER